MLACVRHVVSALMMPSYAAGMAAKARERGDLVEARWWDRVKADVDQAPPLTEDQRSRLAVLLRRTPGPASRTRRPKPPMAA